MQPERGSARPRYGVVGHPVAHSLSPRIHAAFGAQTGIALEYVALLAPRDGFVATVDRFFAEGGLGLNVTLPFKVEAFARCGGRVSARAALAGAVNTLRRVDGEGVGLLVDGDNTDGEGLVADLSRLSRTAGRALAGADLLLIGAGGAARGVVAPLFDAGIGRLTVVNRDPARAREMALHFAGRPIEVAGFAQIDGDGFDVIVNATSAGVDGLALPIAAATLARAGLVYDMMYGAEPTPFLRDAAAAGAAHLADGLGMLVEQAAASFAVWHGVRPDTTAVLEALRTALAGDAMRR
jgi:shikimate dehydrogenase